MTACSWMKSRKSAAPRAAFFSSPGLRVAGDLERLDEFRLISWFRADDSL
jgi:hypothetical protein